MAGNLSATAMAQAEFFSNNKRIPIHDGVRRVVEMKNTKLKDDNGYFLLWHIDVGESENDDHAKTIAQHMNEDNGGNWKFNQILDRFPHEDADEQ